MSDEDQARVTERHRRLRFSVRQQVIATLLLVAFIAIGQLVVGLRAFSDAAFLLTRADASSRQLIAYQRLSIDVLDAMRSIQAAATPVQLVAERRAAVSADRAQLDALVSQESELVLEHGETEDDRAERRRLAAIHVVIGRLLAAMPNGLDALYENELKPLLDAAVRGERAEVEEVQRAMERLQLRMDRLGTVGVLVQVATAALIIVFVGRRVLDPIAGLVADIRTLGRGTLGHRLDTRRRDEFGLLACHINRMAGQIDRRRRLLIESNDRLEHTVAERTEALRESNAELRNIDASRCRFFADVSHELRTPLTAIIGEADVALRIAAPSVEPYLEALCSIRANSTFLNRRIDDLMTLARSNDGRLSFAEETVDLDRVVASAMREINSLARINAVEVRCKPDPSRLTIRGDPMRLKQSLMILLDNAVKFSRSGSTVVIGLDREDRRAVISVSDEGRGIAVEELPHVFERYYQTAVGRSKGGTGLGLAIARDIAAAHRGSLDIRRNEGGGTRVSLVLPLLAQPA